MAEKEIDYMSFFIALVRKEKSEFEVSKEEQIRVFKEIISRMDLKKRIFYND